MARCCSGAGGCEARSAAAGTIPADGGGGPARRDTPEAAAPQVKRARMGPPQILGPKEQRDVREDFEVGKVLGEGQYGITREAKRRDGGEVFAVKTISKKKIVSAAERRETKREIDIMWFLKVRACARWRGVSDRAFARVRPVRPEEPRD